MDQETNNDSWHTGFWSEEWAKKPRVGMNPKPVEKPYEHQEYPKVVGEVIVNSVEEEAALTAEPKPEKPKGKK